MLAGNNKLDIFLNNGSGVFAAPVAYNAGSNASGLTTGDFNGDGKQDVAIVVPGTSGANGTAMIYLNDGTGALTLVATTPDVGLSPTSVAAADIDGDGKDDLAVTNNNGFNSTVSVLLSNGDGTFKTKVAYATDGDPTAIVAVALRSGGKPDLAISTFFGRPRYSTHWRCTFGRQHQLQTGLIQSVTVNDVTRDAFRMWKSPTTSAIQ